MSASPPEGFKRLKPRTLWKPYILDIYSEFYISKSRAESKDFVSMHSRTDLRLSHTTRWPNVELWCLPGYLSPCLQHTEHPREELPWELKHCIPALFPSVSTPSMAYSLEKKNHHLFGIVLRRHALSLVVGVMSSTSLKHRPNGGQILASAPLQTRLYSTQSSPSHCLSVAPPTLHYF